MVSFAESAGAAPTAEASAAATSSEDRCSQLVAKSASRIALYMMREEFRDSASSSSVASAVAKGAGCENTVQHSHDFFVISSCSVEVAIKTPAEGEREQGGATMTLGKTEVPESLFPGSLAAGRSILNKHGWISTEGELASEIFIQMCSIYKILSPSIQ